MPGHRLRMFSLSLNLKQSYESVGFLFSKDCSVRVIKSIALLDDAMILVHHQYKSFSK